MRELITRSLRAIEDTRGARTASTTRIGDHDLNTPPPGRRHLRPAAVLIALVEHPEGLAVVLTRRSEHLHDHAGQISFPGGRIEPADDGPIAAALRETREEIGLDSRFVEVAGCLDDYETVTGYLITPVVSFVQPGFSLTLDAFEVADAFEIPLTFILDPDNHRVHSRLRGNEQRFYHVFEYRDRYIWGATAGMLMNLYRRVTRMPRDAGGGA